MLLIDGITFYLHDKITKGFYTTMSSDPAFRMTVQEVLYIRSRGTVATGQIESRTVTVGDEILIQSRNSSKSTSVHGVEINRKVVEQAKKGDKVGIMMKDITDADIQQGDVLAGSEFDFTWKA